MILASFRKLIQTIVFGVLIPLIDTFIPKSKYQWGFSVHHIKSEQFIENARALFEEVKGDEKIRKIIFTRYKGIELDITDAVNYQVIELYTFRGLYEILRCGVLFVTHSVAMDYSYRYDKSKFTVLKLNLSKRNAVNLWHGIVLKKLFATANPVVRKQLDRVKYRRYERKKYSGLITSSDFDSFSMCSIFHPIHYDNVWVTGLPRNDFLKKELSDLPSYMQKQLEKIHKIKKNRKLITYAPTYRQTAAVTGSSYYQFSEEEIQQLKEVLKKHNAVFGFRMHYFRNNENLFNMEDFCDDEYIFNLGHQVIEEIAPVIRESDVLITDYSSVFIDALYVNKPVFGFVYDIEHYMKEQDGFIYDYRSIFPGQAETSFDKLIKAIDNELSKPMQIESYKYKRQQSFFYKYLDNENSKRVVEKVINSIS